VDFLKSPHFLSLNYTNHAYHGLFSRGYPASFFFWDSYPPDLGTKPSSRSHATPNVAI
jgi:hypothetical protein